MPHFPTRSNLMRSSRTADTPPICKSKDKIVGVITRCQCPNCDDCESTTYTEITFDEFEEIIDAEGATCGSWFWEGDEDSDEQTGDWNNCIPTGEGTGDALLSFCFGGPFEHLTNASITYVAFIALCAGSGPPQHKYVGTWTDNSTGEVFPVFGDNCPPPP